MCVCTAASPFLAFAIRTDRGAGRQAKVYRCHFCGFEARDRRPKREIGRAGGFQ